MKKIAMVVGEDFWLRIPMNNESAGRHLCMDDVEVIYAWLESGYGGCWTLQLETDGEQLEGVAVKVPGSRLGLGTYAVVMAGKFVNGGHFRTKRQLFIRLVDREEQADAKPTMFNEEKAYWAGPAVLSGMLSRDGLNTYELAVLHGYDGTLEQFLAQAGIELQDFMVTKAKLSREVQTQLDKGSEKAINPAGDYDAEVEYSVNEMVYDEVTNSSYVSKQSVNVGHAVTDTDWWMKVLDGNYVHTTIQAIMTAAQATLDEAKQDTIDATTAALEAKQATEQATAAANAVAAQKVADAQIGYYVCETEAGTATKQTTSDVIGENHFAVPYAGGAVKVRMEHANTSTDAVYLQFGTNTNTKRKLYYNGEAASNSNTWDDGEVISVYLDPAANNGAGGYMASNAQGGSNKKIDAYLLGDLRALAVGETYSKDEAIKTSDKQLLRMSKPVETINLSEIVHKGSLYTDGTYTYEADANITEFNPNIEYTAGQYALGSRSVVIIAVTAASTEGTISVTIGDTTADITASTNAETTAASIAALTVEGWTLAADGSNVIATCNTIGNNTLSVSYTDTDSTGTTLTDTAVAGTSVIRKYDGSAWSNATVAGMVTDGIYVERDAVWLATNAAKQNDAVQDLYSVEKKTLTPVKNLYSSWNSTFYSSNYIQMGKSSSIVPNTLYVRKKATYGTTTLVGGASFNKPIINGQRYNLKFDYSNNIIDGVSFSIRDSSRNVSYLNIGSVKLGTGTIDIDFVGNSNMYQLIVSIPGAAPADTTKFVTLYNVTLSKLENTIESEIENIWKTTGVRYYVPDADQWNPGIVKISDGSIVSNSSGVYCEVDITGVKSIRAYLLSSSSFNYGTVFYDSEYNIVGSAAKSSSGWYDIAVPNGAVFMRHQCPASIEDKHLIFYYDKEGDRSNVSSSFSVPMEVGMLISTTGRNHQQSSDANSGNGYAFSSENGEFNIWRNVGMIEVEGDEYTISSDKGDYGSVFLFDSNRNFINRINYNIEVGESVTVNTSAAKYIRFTVSKKHENYPTTPYSPIAEPKCTISGKFSNGLKIAKLKKQTTSAGAADTIITPVWIENTYSTTESTSQLQDTGEWHIDFGRLALPPTYDPDGEPTRLIIICHGTGSRYNPVYSGDSSSQYKYVEGAFNTDSHVTPQHILPEGYALMDMDGIFAIFNEKANSDNVIPYAVKQVANCYQAAYDFVTRNYNIKIDGVLLAGISFGGATALQIITHSNIPVIATALDSPYVCESTLWLWGYAPQWGKSVGIEGIVAGANPPENIDVLKDNYRKMLRFSPILGACHIPKDEFFATTHVEGVGDVSFETSVYYNNGWVKDDKWIKNVVYNWACRMPVPIKIWVSASDANVEPSIAGEMLYNVALNGGSDIEYRVIPGNVHTPSVGSGTTYISNYVTKYGETIASMPLVYAEMIRFFRRYEQD